MARIHTLSLTLSLSHTHTRIHTQAHTHTHAHTLTHTRFCRTNNAGGDGGWHEYTHSLSHKHTYFICIPLLLYPGISTERISWSNTRTLSHIHTFSHTQIFILFSTQVFLRSKSCWSNTQTLSHIHIFSHTHIHFFLYTGIPAEQIMLVEYTHSVSHTHISSRTCIYMFISHTHTFPHIYASIYVCFNTRAFLSSEQYWSNTHTLSHIHTFSHIHIYFFKYTGIPAEQIMLVEYTHSVTHTQISSHTNIFLLFVLFLIHRHSYRANNTDAIHTLSRTYTHFLTYIPFLF